MGDARAVKIADSRDELLEESATFVFGEPGEKELLALLLDVTRQLPLNGVLHDQEEVLARLDYLLTTHIPRTA